MDSLIDKVAFEEADRGYTVRASYLKEPRKADALIEIFKDGQPLRAFYFPAYKIWNIAAHFSDIVDGELEGNTSGYEMAAWNGITNAIVILPKPFTHDAGEIDAAVSDGRCGASEQERAAWAKENLS